jgi:glutamate-1-semialdehyde 2,1-aminomutase
LNGISRATGVPTQLNRVGSVMTVFFTPDPVSDFESAMRSDTERYGQHYRQMLSTGIYLAPSQFEAAFVSMAHSEKDLDTAAKMTEWSFKKLLEK